MILYFWVPRSRPPRIFLPIPVSFKPYLNDSTYEFLLLSPLSCTLTLPLPLY